MIGPHINVPIIIFLVAAIAIILYSIHVITVVRTRRALFHLNREVTSNALESFLESAMVDQPLLEFAQRGFQALSGEMVFLDARLEKKVSSDIPVYDLREWNTAHHKDLPRLIDVTPQGIAVKFEHPRIWYEIVFTSRRGYGTIAARRFMLAAVSNRIQELLMMYERQSRKNN